MVKEKLKWLEKTRIMTRALESRNETLIIYSYRNTVTRKEWYDEMSDGAIRNVRS